MEKMIPRFEKEIQDSQADVQSVANLFNFYNDNMMDAPEERAKEWSESRSEAYEWGLATRVRQVAK